MLRIAVATGLLALTACSPVKIDSTSALNSGAKYVAMGSSFAAGAAIGQTKPGTPERCGRTVNNYATLLAAHLDLALDDQSCGGATTLHVLDPWNELPAQIDAVGAGTRLVTVTIGGNDVNYVGTLFMASCTPGEIVEAGEYKIPCLSPQPPADEAYARVESGLRAIAREVKRRAPNARLVFVQYVSLVPDSPCKSADLSDAELEMTRAIGTQLAWITAYVARSTGSLLLEADKLSQNHTPCDAIPWANGMSDKIDLTHGAPWHPNAAGHLAIAESLGALLKVQM